MRLKYFLRGLGVGILVTVLVLSISHRAQDRKTVLSNQDIISEAEKLGMVMEEEATEESPSSEEEISSPEPSVTPEPSEEPEPSESPAPSEEPDDSEENTDSETEKESESEPVKEETPKEEPAQKQSISITIERGMWSESVSRALSQAGLVDDADDFNQYLTENGYASDISVGTYQLEEGMSYHDIASRITGH